MENNKLETLINELQATLKGSPIYIFPNHKFAYGYVFGEDVVKNSPYYRQAVMPTGRKSVLDICKDLDKSDKVGLYNVYVSSGQITIQVIITDETTLTSLDLSNNDFVMSGLID